MTHHTPIKRLLIANRGEYNWRVDQHASYLCTLSSREPK